MQPQNLRQKIARLLQKRSNRKGHARARSLALESLQARELFATVTTGYKVDPAEVEINSFGLQAGYDNQNPRMTADVNNDGSQDVVGFADDGVYVSLANGDGSFGSPKKWVGSYGYDATGWRVEKHPRMMADVNGDGNDDVVGFANAGVYVSLSNGKNAFSPAKRWVGSFGYNSTGWRVEKHPRMMADVNGDGNADVVGFANAGVYVSLSNGKDAFSPAKRWVGSFGYNSTGWRVEKHPRMMADVNGDGNADVVGFGSAGAYVSLSNGRDGFGAAKLWVDSFGYSAGGWRVNQHVRTMADVNGDGKADVIGFGGTYTYVSTSTGGGFADPLRVSSSFGKGWTSANPRMVADVNGDGTADLVGFANHGVVVSESRALVTVNGTNAVDSVLVSAAGDSVLVSVNGARHWFNKPEAGKIYAYLQGGDDDFTNTTDITTVVYGHSGHDTLQGGSGRDVLVGREGNDLIWGGAGDDLLSGGDNDDRLFGEQGRDVLYGDNGHDSLVGGADTVKDILVGGSGKDRVLVTSLWDSSSDVTSEDARITFLNGGQKTETLGSNFGEVTVGAANWTDLELETVDDAFQHMFDTAATNKLLRTADGSSSVTVVRQGTVTNAAGTINTSVGGWNGDGTITLINNTFGGGVASVLQTVFHEMGHNWDEESENDVIEDFRSISWRDKTYCQLFDCNNTVQATDGDWADWKYVNRNAGLDGFARNYGKMNPLEDWATSFAAYMMYQTGLAYEGDNTSNADMKIRCDDRFDVIDDFFASL